MSSVEWSPDGKWLAMLVAPGGGLNQQVYLMHPDGSGFAAHVVAGHQQSLTAWQPLAAMAEALEVTPIQLQAQPPPE